MALVDVYDAMVSRRIYKEPVSHSEAVQIIVQASGRQFDPAMVEAFVRGEERWNNIALSFSDDLPKSGVG